MRPTGDHRAAPAELLVLLLPPLERPCVQRRVVLLDCMLLVISEVSDAGSAGGLTFPFEVFTDSLPDLSHVKKIF